MPHIAEIKTLFDRGDYQQAREMCLEGIYACHEHAFLHSGTELQNSREAELREYLLLKDRVIFHEIREYFNRKTSKIWNQDMQKRLTHFIIMVKLILSDNRDALKAHIQKAPGVLFFSEYKHLIAHLDETNIRARQAELIQWLQALPCADKELTLELAAAFHRFKQGKEKIESALASELPKKQLQLRLFPK